METVSFNGETCIHLNLTKITFEATQGSSVFFSLEILIIIKIVIKIHNFHIQ